MHPELTSQHTRLPSASFGKRCHNFTNGPKPGEEKLPKSASRSPGTLGIERGCRWAHFWDADGGLIHCVMRTAGNGVTFCGGTGRQRGHSRSVSQRTEPDPVRPSQHQLSVAQHRRHTLPIILCLFLRPSISRDGSVSRRPPSPRAACTAHRFGRFL